MSTRLKQTKRTRTPKSNPPARAMVSPLNGARCPTGGKPGNAGGGRRPSAVRETCLLAFDERIPRLKMIADGVMSFTQACPKCGHTEATSPYPVTDAGDMINAVDKLARYGLGERSEFSEDVVADNVDRMLQIAQALMSDTDYAAYCRQVDSIWNGRRG
jgi:hypothetical protein